MLSASIRWNGVNQSSIPDQERTKRNQLENTNFPGSNSFILTERFHSLIIGNEHRFEFTIRQLTRDLSAGLLLQRGWGLSVQVVVVWSTFLGGSCRFNRSRNHYSICCEAKNLNKQFTATSCPMKSIVSVYNSKVSVYLLLAFLYWLLIYFINSIKHTHWRICIWEWLLWSKKRIK